ncbi:ATP-binding protein [Streptosporangium roseum]|uniref:ATP-binding protein n=1 Tax=Streptosporangium roseum TaxID=2001 RepID=UPI00332C5BE8
MRALGLLGQMELPAGVAAVPRMRRYVRDLLDDTEHARTDDALLLVTELVTNSVRHSDSGRVPGGRIAVAVADHAGTLHIDVIDAGSTGNRPALCPDITCDDGGGRGLWLVQELATAWGWYETAVGRVVWFQLSGRRPPHEEHGETPLRPSASPAHPAEEGRSPAGPGAGRLPGQAQSRRQAQSWPSSRSSASSRVPS